MLRICAECGDEYDTLSPKKIAARGLIIHCPDCSEETVVRYAGLQSGDGKQSQTTILKFNSDQDRSGYMKFWKTTLAIIKQKVVNLAITCQQPQTFSLRRLFRRKTSITKEKHEF